MEKIIKYRGRIYSHEDIQEIRDLIELHKDTNRSFISRELCKKWNWVQSNGHLKEIVCRGFLLYLHRQNIIELPPPKRVNYAISSRSNRPEKVEINDSPIECSLPDLGYIELIQVRRTKLEKFYKGIIEHYHYLNYVRPVGEHLEFMFFANQRPIACMGFCSAPLHINIRDKHIGWDKERRTKNLHKILINTRFLILPWIRVPHLASHLLGKISRVISKYWEDIYNHEIIWLETFVDPSKGYKGTCYKAANWQYLGMTKGIGRYSKTQKVDRSLKLMFGFPLAKHYKRILND